MLLDKKVMVEEQIRLLKFIHTNLRISLGGKEVSTSKGVPQGLTSSPPLFNTYTESFLERLE